MQGPQVERSLTVGERELLAWLVRSGLSPDSPYVAQVSSARVVGRCDCGCPTIDLQVSASPPARELGLEDIVNAYGESPEGVKVGVILFARGGELCSLEVYSVEGEPTYTLPSPAALTLE